MYKRGQKTSSVSFEGGPGKKKQEGTVKKVSMPRAEGGRLEKKISFQGSSSVYKSRKSKENLQVSSGVRSRKRPQGSPFQMVG